METTHESSKQTLCSAQPAKPYAFSRKVFCEGMRDGVPIALGYFAVSFSLGIAARTAGFTPLQGFVASLLNNASAGEYAAFALIASGATYLEVAIITLIANARYLLMSCALAQRFAPGTPFFTGLSSAMTSLTSCSASPSPAGLSEPLLHLRRHRAGRAGVGFGYGAGHHRGQSAAPAGRQRTERGALRHVPRHHHSSGPER